MLCELTLAATPNMLSAVMNTMMLTAERPPLIANAAAEEVRARTRIPRGSHAWPCP